MTLQNQLKRKNIIRQLNKRGIYAIGKYDLQTVKYTTLLKSLAVERLKEGD